MDKNIRVIWLWSCLRFAVINSSDQYIRLLLEQTLEDLEDERAELLTTSQGQEALELIQAERPNLMFLDVMMPPMRGFDVCQTVKRDLQLDGIYIIMLTATGQEFDKQKGADVGADLYMTKPFDPDAVMEKAIAILGLA